MIYLSPQPRPRNHITTVNISTQKWTCSVVDYLRWDDHFLFQRLHSICATFLAILTRSVEGHIFQYAVYSIDVHQWRRKKSPLLNWIVSDVLSKPSQTMTMQLFLLSCKTFNNLFAVCSACDISFVEKLCHNKKSLTYDSIHTFFHQTFLSILHSCSSFSQTDTDTNKMAWHKGTWWPLAVKVKTNVLLWKEGWIVLVINILFQEWYAPKASQHMFDPYRSDCHFMMTLIQSVFSRIMSSFAASPFWSWGWSSTCFGVQTTLTTGWVASLKQVGSYFIVETGSRCWGGVSSRAGSRRRASHTFHMQGQKNFCKGKQDGRKRKEKQLNVILTGVRIPSCCWAWAGLGDHW